jgi:polar amino acid transport system substrate-binding protein
MLRCRMPNLRTLWRYFLACCWLLLSLAGTASAADDDTLPPDIARIKHAGVLHVVLTKEDYPPFYYRQGNQLKGFDIELANDIASRLKVDVDFKRLASSWENVVQLIGEGKADVAITALSRTLPRAQKVAYTQPYVTLPQALLVNRLKLAGLGGDQPPLQRLNNSSVRIGTLAESSYINFAQAAFPAAQLLRYSHWDAAMEALQVGEIHAVMFDALLCKRTLLTKPQLALNIQLLVTERPDPIAMAVNWHDRELLQWLNIYIDTVRGEGYLKQLQDKYLGAEEVRNAAD